MANTHPARRDSVLPPINIGLIDNSGAFKKQAESTRRHFELKSKKAKPDGQCPSCFMAIRVVLLMSIPVGVIKRCRDDKPA